MNPIENCRCPIQTRQNFRTPTVSSSRGLLKSSLVVGVMTMLSRVLGLARDIVFANFLGATAAADAFFVAFKIPNFLRRLFAEGAFSQAFVPVLSEYRERRSIEAVQGLVNKVSGALGGSLLLVTGISCGRCPRSYGAVRSRILYGG